MVNKGLLSILLIAVFLTLSTPAIVHKGELPFRYIHVFTPEKPTGKTNDFNQKRQPVSKPAKKKTLVKKYKYTYKDENGVFRTVTTTKKLNSTIENGRSVYSSATKQGSAISKRINEGFCVVRNKINSAWK